VFLRISTQAGGKKVADDEQIFRKIIDQRDRFYRVAYSYVGNEQDAMDVVQDVAYKAVKNLRRLREPEYAETWLFRVTINTSLDFLRKRSHEQVGLPTEEKGANDNYESLTVFDMLRQLDHTSRAVIILHFMEGKTFQQISAIIEKNVNTVKTLYYKSLKTLKIQLSEEAINHVSESKRLE